MTLPLHPPTQQAIKFWLHFEPNVDFHVRSAFTLRYSGAGAPSTAQLVTAAGLVSAAFNSNLVNLLYSGDACYDVTAGDLTNPSTPKGVNFTQRTGTRAGTQVANNFTCMINFTPARAYRGSKPKIFLPFGITTDVNNPVSWTTTFQTAVNTGWTNFIAALLGGAFGPFSLGNQCVVSYYGPPTILNTGTGRAKYQSTPRNPAIVTDITAIGMSLVAGSQRRRLRP